MEKFDALLTQAVWNKGIMDPKYDLRIYRKDFYGSWMARSDYGNRNSGYGWEIDHVLPQSKGGSDDLYNLRPLQWGNNAKRQAGKIV